MKTTLAVFALVALCIVGIFVWQSNAADQFTPPVYGSPTVKVLAGEGHGSGVFIGGDGLILTAAHVIAKVKTGDSLRVKTEGGNLLDAAVLWSSPNRDVALLQVKNTHGLRAANLSCTAPRSGDSISARGNPGPLEFFTSWGHFAGTVQEYGPWLEVVATDITVLMGMSGGPAFNSRGDVVGLVVGALLAPINSSTSLTGISFVVPGSTICPLLGRS